MQNTARETKMKYPMISFSGNSYMDIQAFEEQEVEGIG